MARVALAVERARAAGVPVIWVQHADDELVERSPGWEWVPELVAADGELGIPKNYNSAFEATDLDDRLAELGVSHVVLASAATNWCIRATAYGALDRGCDLTLVADAHTTRTVETRGLRVEAETIVADLNMTMSGVDYPGVTTRVRAADRVDFTALGG